MRTDSTSTTLVRASASPEAEIHALDLAAARDAGEVLEGEGLLEDSLLDRQDLPAAPSPAGLPSRAAIWSPSPSSPAGSLPWRSASQPPRATGPPG